jgi:hypothetical protein
VAAVVACVWLAVGSVVASAAVAGVHGATPDGDAVADVVRQLRRGPQPPGLVLLRFADPAFTGVLDTVLADLESRHVPVRVDETLGFMFGPWRTGSPSDAAEIWYVTENGASYALLAASPGARLVARTTPLDDPTDARLSRLQVAVAAQLREAGHPELVGALDSELADLVLAQTAGIDQTAVAEVAKLNRARRHRPRFGIIAFPASQPPDQWWSTG